MNTEILTLGLSIAGVVLATVALFWCMKNSMNAPCVDVDDEDEDDDLDEGLTIVASFNNPRPVLHALAMEYDWDAYKHVIDGFNTTLKYVPDVKDAILADMQGEEMFLRGRLGGVCDVLTSDDFKKWSEADQMLLKDQAYGMKVYHDALLRRCLRFGVIDWADEKKG